MYGLALAAVLFASSPVEPAFLQPGTLRAPSADTSDGPHRLRATWGHLKFETAKVTPNTSEKSDWSSNVPLGAGDWYGSPGGRFSARNLPLTTYIGFAYRINETGAVSLRQQLPDWTRTERYDIEARAADRKTTKDQMRLMVQALLADQFKLQIHTESHETSVFLLKLRAPGQMGPQFQQHAVKDATCSKKPSWKHVGMFPATCGGITTELPPTKPGNKRFAARNVDMDLITGFLSSLGGIDRPVVDSTGLNGMFDFNLEWTPDSPAHPLGATALSIFSPRVSITQALDTELGLVLEPGTAPIDTLILDHVEPLLTQTLSDRVVPR